MQAPPILLTMTRPVYVAYLLVLIGLVIAGFLVKVAWWVGVLIAVGAGTPIVVADIVTTRRRRHTRTSAPPA